MMAAFPPSPASLCRPVFPQVKIFFLEIAQNLRGPTVCRGGGGDSEKKKWSSGVLFCFLKKENVGIRFSGASAD